LATTAMWNKNVKSCRMYCGIWVWRWWQHYHVWSEMSCCKFYTYEETGQNITLGRYRYTAFLVTKISFQPSVGQRWDTQIKDCGMNMCRVLRVSAWWRMGIVQFWNDHEGNTEGTRSRKSSNATFPTTSVV